MSSAVDRILYFSIKKKFQNPCITQQFLNQSPFHIDFQCLHSTLINNPSYLITFLLVHRFGNDHMKMGKIFGNLYRMFLGKYCQQSNNFKCQKCQKRKRLTRIFLQNKKSTATFDQCCHLQQCLLVHLPVKRGDKVASIFYSNSSKKANNKELD